ncbi:MAG: hypothetical protein EX330_10405 [Candidatus Brocadia sp. BROELEC01]|nr:MAG: hypothetical protein EX330_10405 [Candidatus Brocadia sp. BROELEC01]
MHRRKMSIIFRVFVTVLSVFCAGIPATLANEYQIAVLAGRNESPYKEVIDGFQKTVTEQKRHVKYSVFVIEGEKEQTSQILDTIKKINPDVIFTVGTTPVVEVIRMFTDIPIIATFILDDSAIKHARNVTGVILSFPAEIQFSWLKKFLPDVRKIGVMYNPAENQENIRSATRVAKMMGLECKSVEIHSPKDIPAALKILANDIDILWGINDPLVYNSLTAKQILLFSFRNQIPFCGLSSAWVKAGALYSLEYDFYDIGVQCGEKAVKIQQGVEVISIPVSFPRNLRYVLNLRTARRMKVVFQEKYIHDAYQIYDE